MTENLSEEIEIILIMVVLRLEVKWCEMWDQRLHHSSWLRFEYRNVDRTVTVCKGKDFVVGELWWERTPKVIEEWRTGMVDVEFWVVSK